MKRSTRGAVRLFFTLWPKDEERTAMASWQGPLLKLCGGRSIPADILHSTLVFFGNVDVERLEALQLAAQEVSGSAFKLILDVARYWGQNHIVYAAPSHVPAQLIGLVEALEKSLHRHHFNFDQRVYKPHVTLLRHAHFTDRPLPTMQKIIWEINDFSLMRSIGGEQGAKYETLCRVPLGKQLQIQ